MNLGYLVLVPPLLIFIVTLITRNVLLSLIVGVFSAGIIATQFSLGQGICLVAKRLIEQTGFVDLINRTGSYDKVYMFGFLIFLGILIEFMTHSGGMRVFTRLFLKRLKSPRAAEMTSLSLSTFFFMDDYLDALTVGSIMRPISDHFKIPRIKLAYLLNAVSSSLAVLVPASSWVGMILTQLQVSGITRVVGPTTLLAVDPFQLYIYVIPFLFYPMLSILAAWYTVWRRISFGLMHRHEEQAMRDGNLFGGKGPLDIRTDAPLSKEGSRADVLLPLLTFVVVCAFVLLYTGKWSLLGGEVSFGTAFMTGDSVLAFFCASLLAVVVSGLCIVFKEHVPLSQLAKLAVQGVALMKNSLIILWLAWTLANMLRADLHTGSYIAQFLSNAVGIALVPIIVFLVATITTASTGSSWGTIMLLMPLALPLVKSFMGQPPLPFSSIYQFAPVVGALLSGSIAGSHFSPITDAMIISATSAQAYHLDHVQTQVSYSIAPLVGAIAAFLCAGFMHQSPLYIRALASLGIGLGVCIIFIQLRNRPHATAV